MLIFYDFLAILYILCFAYNWKAVSLLSTSATLLVSLYNEYSHIFSYQYFHGMLANPKTTRNSQKTFKKHPTFISTKHMLTI